MKVTTTSLDSAKRLIEKGYRDLDRIAYASGATTQAVRLLLASSHLAIVERPEVATPVVVAPTIKPMAEPAAEPAAEPIVIRKREPEPMHIRAGGVDVRKQMSLDRRRPRTNVVPVAAIAEIVGARMPGVRGRASEFNPTRRQIRLCCQAIRATWSDAERDERRYGVQDRLSA